MIQRIAKRALLLAGGFGTRLRPLTDRLPKCLVPIGGRPLLELWLDRLFLSNAEVSMDEVLVNTHYMPRSVDQFIAQSRWKSRVTIVHEPVLLGTAGTIRANADWFGEQPLLLAHADNFSVFQLAQFQDVFSHRPSQCLGTMMTFSTDTPQSCGIVHCDHRGIISQYWEKDSNAQGHLANAAVFLLDAKIHHVLAAHPNDSDFCGHTVPRLVGCLNTFHNSTYHRDIGTLHAYESAQADLRAGIVSLTEGLSHQ